LESSRCSCSLCSSQGAVCAFRNAIGPRRGADTLRRRAQKKTSQGPPRGGPGVVPSKRNSDDRRIQTRVADPRDNTSRRLRL
jgi:hypothetical protein